METHIYEKLGQIGVSPRNPAKTEFRFRLRFDAYERPLCIEFDVSARAMMHLMRGLQQLQATHSIPIPRSLLPRGKPSLRVVTSDDD